MTDPNDNFDPTKMDAFQLTDAEVDRLNELAAPFVASVQRAFGSRTTEAMTNLIASQLGHALAHAAGDDGFYIMECVNDWLRVVARNHHGGLPLQLRWDDDLAATLTKETAPPATH